MSDEHGLEGGENTAMTRVDSPIATSGALDGGGKRARILLISPQLRVHKVQLPRFQPSLGLGYMAAVLEQCGHEVKILDAAIEGVATVIDEGEGLSTIGLTDAELKARVAEYAPDLVGISCLFSSQAGQAFHVADLVKQLNQEIVVVLGGIHASEMFAKVMEAQPSIDYILRGEGDFALEALATRLVNSGDVRTLPGVVWRENGQVRSTPTGPLIPDINVLPMPAWHLMEMEKYFQVGLFHAPYSQTGRVGSIMTSRGCPEHCFFCSSSEYFGHRFRPRSAENVINEITHLKKTYAIDEIQIEDDVFTTNPKRVHDICAGIQPLTLRLCTPNGIRADYPTDMKRKREMFRAMKEAGFYQITFGVESGVQWVIDNLVKKRLDLSQIGPSIRVAQEEGLLVHTFFILGFPTETKEQMLATIKFAEEIQADSYSFSIASPLPGTVMWQMCEKLGLFVEGFDPTQIVFTKTNIKQVDMTGEELFNLVYETNRRLNEEAKHRSAERLELYEQLARRASNLGSRPKHSVTGTVGARSLFDGGAS